MLRVTSGSVGYGCKLSVLRLPTCKKRISTIDSECSYRMIDCKKMYRLKRVSVALLLFWTMQAFDITWQQGEHRLTCVCKTGLFASGVKDTSVAIQYAQQLCTAFTLQLIALASQCMTSNINFLIEAR